LVSEKTWNSLGAVEDILVPVSFGLDGSIRVKLVSVHKWKRYDRMYLLSIF